MTTTVPRLDAWRLVETGTGNVILIGRVYGRRRAPDGAVVVTSPVERLSDDLATTRSGSVYRLGAPWPADEALPEAYRHAIAEKLLLAAGGALTPSKLAAVTATAARCCLPGAAAGEEILARLRRTNA